ncbi:hypothetical protein B6V71_24290 [Escherichia coli]|nr:hypothetical protein [Escherichia coli]
MALSPAPSPLHFSWSGRRISEKPVNAARSRGDFLPHFLQTAPFPARPERVSATALKPPRKAGGRGGESTARQ